MTTGFELMLAAALCLSCPNDTIRYPDGFLQLNDKGEYVTPIDIMPLQDGIDASLDDDVPIETLQTLVRKAEKLKTLRTWINGYHLRIATLEDYPLSYTKRYDNGTVVGLGVAFELIDFLKEKFNFTYEVLVPEGNIIGSKNDYANSLIEMLNSTKADIAAAFLPLLSEQRGFVYYSTTVLDEGEWIMVMQRPNESASGSGLMAPFDYWVWILIFISVLTVGPIIYFLIILRNKLTGDTEQKAYSLNHCAWFVYGALMKQGSTLSPIADSTRMIFATWWIFITILTSFYTANLTAFLTLSKFTLPFNTVNDILIKNKHFVSQRGSGVEYSIKTTNESLSILNRMAAKNYAVFSDAINDTYNLHNYVEKNGYVFVRDRPAITHALYLDYRYRKAVSINNEKIHCPFAKAKEPFLKKKRSFAYPKGSNLSELFDRELLNLVESGIIKYLSNKDLPNAEICPQDLGGTERQLRNGDLLMTYYIMFAGFGTAFAVFTTEMLFRLINRSQDSDFQWCTHGVGRTPNGGFFKPSKWFSPKIRTDSANVLLSSSKYSNVTPPPPYQSIFSSKNYKNNSSLKRWPHPARFGDNRNSGGFGALRAPAIPDNQYSGVGLTSTGLRKFINGREYMVYRTTDGQSQLVPVRSPSAAIFQYTFSE